MLRDMEVERRKMVARLERRKPPSPTDIQKITATIRRGWSRRTRWHRAAKAYRQRRVTVQAVSEAELIEALRE